MKKLKIKKLTKAELLKIKGGMEDGISTQVSLAQTFIHRR